MDKIKKSLVFKVIAISIIALLIYEFAQQLATFIFAFG